MIRVYWEVSSGRLIFKSTALEDLVSLKQLFLAASKGEPVNFSRIEFISSPDVAVYCGLSATGSGRVGIHWISKTELCWLETSEQWEWEADLVDGIIEFDQPCHQYLTSHVTDDVTVILSWRE